MFEILDGWLCWDFSSCKQRISIFLCLNGAYNQSWLRRASHYHFRGQQVKVLADDEKSQLLTSNNTSTA
jgi:hypothetical protein